MKVHAQFQIYRSIRTDRQTYDTVTDRKTEITFFQSLRKTEITFFQSLRGLASLTLHEKVSELLISLSDEEVEALIVTGYNRRT
ncbi:hypothetical protein J6590_074324 [Homalodisca vitripennis]|nr:hypothetical protein J6590_074324 [Homalodisca vitripennis]